MIMMMIVMIVMMMMMIIMIMMMIVMIVMMIVMMMLMLMMVIVYCNCEFSNDVKEKDDYDSNCNVNDDMYNTLLLTTYVSLYSCMM